MKGICKPKETGVCCFVDGTSAVRIGVNNRQKWEFERLPSGKVSVYRDCITMRVPRLQFETDWEIVKSE